MDELPARFDVEPQADVPIDTSPISSADEAESAEESAGEEQGEAEQKGPVAA